MVRVIMTQTENTQPTCEFQTQSILVPRVLATGNRYVKRVGLGHHFDLTASNLKAS